MAFTLRKELGEKISEWILGVSKKVWVVILVVLIVIFGMSQGFGWVLHNIHFLSISDTYDTFAGLTEHLPNGVRNVLETLPFRCIILALIIIDIVLLLWKRKYILISLCSFSPDLGIADVMKKNRRVSKRRLDLCDEMRRGDISSAVKKADDFISRTAYKRGNAEVGLYGVMHTPFLFRIGYGLGDQSNFDLYHKKRNDESSFHEWEHETDSYHIKTDEKHKGLKSDEMIVEICTSFVIKDSEITDLSPDNKHILIFTGSSIGFDVLRNYPDANSVRDEIMSDIRNAVKKYRIHKIHMVIASSVAFTIFLGMSYSKQHDPECIVYHYEKERYPWGIDIDAAPENCLVKNF